MISFCCLHQCRIKIINIVCLLMKAVENNMVSIRLILFIFLIHVWVRWHVERSTWHVSVPSSCPSRNILVTSVCFTLRKFPVGFMHSMANQYCPETRPVNTYVSQGGMTPLPSKQIYKYMHCYFICLVKG